MNSIAADNFNSNDKNHINEAVLALSRINNDITIISKDNEKVFANKYFLSTFASTLAPLLLIPSYDQTFLNLPACSSSSLKFLIKTIKMFVLLDLNETNDKSIICEEDLKKRINLDCINVTSVKSINTNEDFKKNSIDINDKLEYINITNDKSISAEEDLSNIFANVIFKTEKNQDKVPESEPLDKSDFKQNVTKQAS